MLSVVDSAHAASMGCGASSVVETCPTPAASPPEGGLVPVAPADDGYIGRRTESLSMQSMSHAQAAELPRFEPHAAVADACNLSFDSGRSPPADATLAPV